MPQALQVDWNLIRELYNKGLTLRQISEQTGVQQSTISSRATRAAWKATAMKANAIMQGASVEVKVSQPAENKLAQSSDRVRSGLAGVLERSIDRLEQLSFKTPKAALKANQELESVVRNAKTVFGWSEGQSSPSVRIAIMGSTSVQIDQDPRPVIDLPVVENKVEPQA